MKDSIMAEPVNNKAKRLLAPRPRSSPKEIKQKAEDAILN